jgi:hypothetical protein
MTAGTFTLPNELTARQDVLLLVQDDWLARLYSGENKAIPTSSARPACAMRSYGM